MKIQTKQFNIINVFRRIDGLTVLLYLTLVLMGWFNIYAAVLNENSSGIFDVSYKYGKQMIWIIASIIIAVSLIIIDSKFYSILAYPSYIFMLLILLAVIFMPSAKGQSSWFVIGDFKIQPAEFAKITTALVLSRYISGYNIKITEWKHLKRIAAIIGIPIILIALQPDMGTTLVFASFLLVLYRHGMPGWVLVAFAISILIFSFSFIFSPLYVSIVALSVLFIFLLFSISYHRISYKIVVPTLLSFSLPWVVVYYYNIDFSEFLLFLISFVALVIPLIVYSYRKKIATLFIIFIIGLGSISFSYSVDYMFHNMLQDHQKTRINVLFGLESDTQGVEYNVIQSKIAIGSGGFDGKGYLQGTQTKHNFVPEQSTDFIFCTVGEEWGFVGTSVVIFLFLFLLIRLVILAERQRSIFSRVYGYSVASIFFFHFMVNIGMTVGLMPVIGIPLPFFSYGGSSLWAFTILLFIFVKLDADRDILIY
ncbi:MAG: rod shape-determining protein RodA [Bacteroidales bacterium]|jgi:rod shape determining protein RodA|nr:rod shape-determining protein RodA [Bacteroidales bacterium]